MSFKRDYDFYFRHKDKFTFCGQTLPLLELNPAGKSAKECFKIFDSTGKLVPCSEPELLQQVLRCKKSINLHLKMWAEGFEDCGQSIEEYLEEFDNPPAWVRKALEQQVRKKAL